MAELLRDKVYQVALGSRWNFFLIQATDEEDLIRHLVAHHPNRSDICGVTEILPDGSTRSAKILSHPLFEKLYAHAETQRISNPLPPGVVMIHRKPWAIRLPTGGMTPDSPSRWNSLLSITGKDNDRTHHVDMASWCLESPSPNNPDHHARRGIMSAQHWDLLTPNLDNEITAGFRPVLIPLDPDTMQPRPSVFLGREDGDLFCMGTLYMDGQPLPNPKNPTVEGDIPDYHPGAALYIGDTDQNRNNCITWIKVGDALVCDRNILKGVSWNDLDRMGLARGPELLHKDKTPLDQKMKNAQERAGTALTRNVEKIPSLSR